MDNPRAWLAARVRTMQVIALVLPAGALMMATLMIFLRANQPVDPGANPPALPIVSLLACGMFAVQAGLSFIVPPMIRQAGLRRLAGATVSAAPEALVGVYQASMITALALLEGAVMFAAIAYLIEGKFWAIAPIAIGIPLMALHLPNETRVIRWLEEADEGLKKLRLAGRP